MTDTPVFANDAVVIGILFLILSFVFITEASKNTFFRKFYKIFPPILLCYFLPGILNSFNIISAKESGIYPFVSKYLLPACLVLFTLSLDIKTLKKLGYKAILVFFAGTAGVVIGGPVAVLIVKFFWPEVFMGEGADEVYRGLATIAGSWIGGGANQTALKEVFQPSAFLFSQSVAVDIIVAETWLAVLLVGIIKKDRINKWLGADASIIDEIKDNLAKEALANHKIPVFVDYIKILTVGFGATAIAYFLSDNITPFIENNYPELERYSLTSGFFWVVCIVTFIGISLSQTKVRKLEYVGASKIATVFLYILIASIGMQMDLFAISENWKLILIGVIWILFHAVFVIVAAKLLKAPFFFAAVGSQANVGGAASASVVAAAYHPSLISVGVILSVLGYAVGTYAGYICTILMQWASQ